LNYRHHIIKMKIGAILIVIGLKTLHFIFLNLIWYIFVFWYLLQIDFVTAKGALDDKFKHTGNGGKVKWIMNIMLLGIKIFKN